MADQTYTGVLPGQSAYDAYQAQADAAYAAAQAKIGAQRSALQTSYGYNADGSVQANNPTGQYQQTLGSNAQSAEGLQAAQAGGFGGGLAQQQQEGVQAGAGSAIAGVGQQYGQGNADLDSQSYDQTQQYNDGLYNAMLQNIQTGIDNGQFNPAPPAADGGYGDPNAPWTPPGVPKTGGTGVKLPPRTAAPPAKHVGVKTSHYGNWDKKTGRWIPYKKKGGK